MTLIILTGVFDPPPTAPSIGWSALSDGAIDRNGKPVGTDFSNTYAAGTLALAGKPVDAYDPELQHAAEKAVFGGRDVPFYGWHYPPFFFAVAVIVASVPYGWGLFIWLAASLAAYLAVIRAILNYAPIIVQVPDSVRIRHIDPISALQSMTYYLSPNKIKAKRIR